jgi:hypothetical protein
MGRIIAPTWRCAKRFDDTGVMKTSSSRDEREPAADSRAHRRVKPIPPQAAMSPRRLALIALAAALAAGCAAATKPAPDRNAPQPATGYKFRG